ICLEYISFIYCFSHTTASTEFYTLSLHDALPIFITKKVIADILFKGYVHHASRDEPQYIIKSDKTDHVAIHKGRVLKHLTAQTERRSRKPNPNRKARRERRS